MSKRRRHHKVEKLSTRQLIDQMLGDGRTYEEIAEAVKEAGESIGKSSIARYYTKYASAAERIQKAREAMASAIDLVRDRPDTDLGQFASAIMMQSLADRLAQATSEDFEEIPMEKVGRIIADLQKADVARERLKLAHNKGVEAAVAQIKAQLRDELGNRPDLVEQLATIVDQAAQKAQVS
ncbi:MAG: phage protein Gp27 family protein [Bacillota bacterium]